MTTTLEARNLERIRKTVVELGRLAYADRPDWPGEVYQFLGRAGAILDIDAEEYQK